MTLTHNTAMSRDSGSKANKPYGVTKKHFKKKH